MKRRNWKTVQPTSLNHAMELCLQYARERHNLSVDHIADLMGLTSKWMLYKWLENGRLPSILIRPFEAACRINFITQYLAHSDHRLLIDVPSGRKATAKDINSLQIAFSSSVSLLLKFYEGKTEAEETLAKLNQLMESIAWHQGNVERHSQPEFDFRE